MDAMVIIGAGECGTRAAFALREQGWDGAITLIGAEAGLPYERPPLSKPLAGAVHRKPICDDAALRAARIDYLPGVSATAVDAPGRSVRLSDGRRLPWHRLLMATGARPRRLACPGAGLARGFRSDADAARIFAGGTAGARVAIIGAGLIGMELAAALRVRGAEVAVVESAAAPLGRAVPPHLAARLHARHLAEGVTFHLGAGVAALEEGGVILADGRRIPADHIVAAIGVSPDTALAEAAGLDCANGILTDRFLCTSHAGILAAGDCASVRDEAGVARRSESWRDARLQAETAARNMLGASQAHVARPWFWSDQFDLGLQIAGRPSTDQAMVRRIIAQDAELSFHLDGGRLVAAAGLGPGNCVARDIRLAEMLIEADARPDPSALADPAITLKALLRTAKAA
ncbi:NAD(P)/FAD-dependent oxidoreductase [Paracoccus spongiarum]|uniref:FAD-dependent oxidoreductase n=1 Tax=Paracoccus spongiarum TaxID=3064387 RepID=A0ABT9JEA9_9RHOB|nr:FAD-dependent oxidoreductase [Paracoccus sp. 2205BS29-5]MDP5307442.1 FAD-dependent oxidoreductase [Paracoccus sp. 2205BS29-5]